MDVKQNANAIRWTLFPKYHSGYVSRLFLLSKVFSVKRTHNQLSVVVSTLDLAPCPISPFNPVLISPSTLDNTTTTINFFGTSLHRAVTGKMGINRPTQGFSSLCPQPAAGKRLKAIQEKYVVRKHNVLSSVFIFPTLFDILRYSCTGNRKTKNRKYIIT